MADTRVPTECPGGCGDAPPAGKFCCRNCWWLLPENLRKAVTRARGGGRMVAVADAERWLAEHVVDGHLPDMASTGLRFTIDESWRPRGA